MHRSVTVVAAIIVALVRGWQLGLVMLALMPLIAIAGGIRSTLTTWGTKRQSEAFAKANGLSSQAIQNVRTVQSFQAEDGILKKFADLLEGPRKVSVKLGALAGMGTGFIFMCICTTCVLPCPVELVVRQGCNLRVATSSDSN